MTQKTKEIQITPRISEHDYQHKLKRVFEFIGKGNKIKVVLSLRGREYHVHKDNALEQLTRIVADTKSVAVVESMPKDKGAQQKKIIMILRPK